MLNLKTSLRLLVPLSLLVGFGAACSSTGLGKLPPEEYEQDETSPIVGAPDGGAPAGGAGGGGPVRAVDCHPEGMIEGNPGSCEAVDPDNSCQACVQERCCVEQSACNATAPDSVCSFGSTLFESRAVDGGEIGCMMECFASRDENGEFSASEDDLDACSSQCAASECSDSSIRPPSSALAACIIGVGQEYAGCRSECGFTEE